MKNRILSILLSICMMMSSLSSFVSFADETQAETYKDVSVSMYSNLISDDSLSGLYSENIFYAPIDKLAAITGGEIVRNEDDMVIINYSNEVRKVFLVPSSNYMLDSFLERNFELDLPMVVQDGVTYASVIHYLEYLGTEYTLSKETTPQLMVMDRYDMIDALGEWVLNDHRYFFTWAEVDVEGADLEDMLVNAGVVALIDKDSNLLRMIFDASGIQRETLEELLITIVTNEGKGYLKEGSELASELDYAGGGISLSNDLIDFWGNTFDIDVDTIEETKVMKDAGIATDAINAVVKGYSSYDQFNNIAEAQQDLLSDTLLKYPDMSETIVNGWEVIEEAARNTDARIKNEYKNNFEAAKVTARNGIFAIISNTASAKISPVTAAWDRIVFIVKALDLNGVIENKTKLSNAYYCSMIGYAVNDIFSDKINEWYYNVGSANMGQTPDDAQEAMLYDLKQLLIMVLKATITTRQYLIESEYLETGYANEMKDMLSNIVVLLNKVENSTLSGLALSSVDQTGDLTWMEQIPDMDAGVEMFAELFHDSVFTSGVGSWETTININEDGSFTGKYEDYLIEDIGADYPNGTTNTSSFSGYFIEPRKVDECTYSMQLGGLNIENEAGPIFYDNGIRYVTTNPYGVNKADEFIIYCPGLSIASLPEGFKSWLSVLTNIDLSGTLPVYGLYNVSQDVGFIAYNNNDVIAPSNEGQADILGLWHTFPADPAQMQVAITFYKDKTVSISERDGFYWGTYTTNDDGTIDVYLNSAIKYDNISVTWAQSTMDCKIILSPGNNKEQMIFTQEYDNIGNHFLGNSEVTVTRVHNDNEVYDSVNPIVEEYKNKL